MWCAVMCCDTSLHKLKLFFLPQGKRIQVQSNTCTWKVCRLDTYPFVTPLIPLRGDTFVPALLAPLSSLGHETEPHNEPGAHSRQQCHHLTTAAKLQITLINGQGETSWCHSQNSWSELTLILYPTYPSKYTAFIWDIYCTWSYQSHKTNCGMKGQNPPT